MTGGPYNVYPVEGRRKKRWKRVVLWTAVGLVVVVIAAIGASYLWFRDQVAGANQRVPQEVIKVLTEKPPSSTIVTTPPWAPPSPSAMNVLVLGSDHRADITEQYGRSDTIILVHIDPGRNYLSVLSLPRDLRVEVPGYGLQKINAAYAYGGPALTIKTVEQVTGVDINHYVEVDFNAFKDVTDALGGVYLNVDRRYFNQDPTYELIRLSPGYQLLDGADALAYVRFRHDQNMDFGRMLRQQRFLTAVREQAVGWDLAFKLPSLVTALFKNVTTDLGANDILKLAYWGIRLDGQRIKQVSLVGATDTINNVSYVVADKATIAGAVGDFLTPPVGGSAAGSSTTAGPVSGTTTTVAVPATTTTTAEIATTTPVTGSALAGTPASAPQLSGIEIDVVGANGRAGEGAAVGRWLTSLGASVKAVSDAAGRVEKTTSLSYPPGMSVKARLVAGAVGAQSVTRSSAVQRIVVTVGEDLLLPPDFALPATPETVPSAGGWKTIAQTVPFPVEAPAYIPVGYGFVERMPPTGATYDIKVGGSTKPAFDMLYRLKVDGQYVDQYMSIMETSWVDAPAASKGQQVERNGITYTIVGTSQKVDHVWWRSDGALYWVSNTLSYLLSKQDMLAVAESMIPIPSR